MKKEEINKRINKTINNLISSDFDDVISKINNKEGVIIDMKSDKKNKTKWNAWLVTAVLLIFVGVFGYYFYSNTYVMAKIDLDVNPSIEIEINKKFKVLNVNSYNEDAKKVIGEMELKGSSLEVATNAILGSMLKEGYINEDNNSILVSLSGGDSGLENKIVNIINDYLKSENIEGSYITQEVKDNKTIKEKAEKYDISLGKALLIDKIMSSNPIYTFEELSELNTNELSLLISSKKNNVDEVNVTGTASEKTYIGKDKAKEVAISHSKVVESKIINLEIEIDLEDGIMVYDVEFDYNNNEYDYEINAVTGDIITYENDVVHEKNYEENQSSSNKKYITKDEAKNIVLIKSGVKDYYDYSIDFEYESGVGIYEIEFETVDNEYEYELNATTGNILYSEIEPKKETKSNNTNTMPNNEQNNNETSNNQTNNNSENTNSSLITQAKAKSIAIEHAKVSDYRDFEIELDTEDGVKVYEVSFDTAEKEYEYVINASDGKIIESNEEYHD